MSLTRLQEKLEIEILKKKNQKTIYNSTREIGHSVINLTKDVPSMYAENHKTLLEITKEGPHSEITGWVWKNQYCHFSPDLPIDSRQSN